MKVHKERTMNNEQQKHGIARVPHSRHLRLVISANCSPKLNIHQLFSLLMVILTFSTSFPAVATAQDDSVEAAERDAKVDAKADTNELLWFAAGCGVSIVTFGVAGLVTERYIRAVSPLAESEHPDAERVLAENSESFAALLVVGGGCLLGSAHWGAEAYQPSPPSARLMGKPPQYINAYVAAYKKQKGKTQSKWIDWGLVTGGAVGLIYFISLIDDL